MALLVAQAPARCGASCRCGGWAWKAGHARWLLAVAGLALLRAGRCRSASLLVAAAGSHARRWSYGTHPRALARTATELPGRFVARRVETAALLRGSARYRTPLL